MSRLSSFFLVGLMSIVLEGSIVQLMIATLFCILYLILQLQAKPYKDPSDDFVALSSTASLVVLDFSCVILKVGALTETPEVDAILSPRLRANFKLPNGLLTAIILGSVVCTLFLSLVIGIQIGRDERRRVRTQKLCPDPPSRVSSTPHHTQNVDVVTFLAGAESELTRAKNAQQPTESAVQAGLQRALA